MFNRSNFNFHSYRHLYWKKLKNLIFLKIKNERILCSNPSQLEILLLSSISVYLIFLCTNWNLYKKLKIPQFIKLDNSTHKWAQTDEERIGVWNRNLRGRETERGRENIGEVGGGSRRRERKQWGFDRRCS
jgi:hypothetical protein